ncbi:MAG: nucleotidyltransferase family protein [Victivallales bacterium]|nr:nucleotidyltransferase family protein [Victivallales bacterium]
MVTGKLSNEKLQQALVLYTTNVEQALKCMENEIAVVVDEQNRLRGIVTDGDIRRAFLRGAGIHTPLHEFMTVNPITISENDRFSSSEIMALMLEKKIRHLPVVNEQNIPVGLELLKDQYDENDIARAVLMAGGKGTRLHPLTIDTPKPLLRIGDKTIIDNVIEGLSSSGVSNIAVSVNYLGNQIKDHLRNQNKDNLNIEYLEEKQALGTAGALSLLTPRPERGFIVMNADLMTEVDYKAFVRFHRDGGNDVSICVRKIQETIPFGVVELGADNREVIDVKEKPVNTYLVNAGIYMLEPWIIDLIPQNAPYDMVSLIQSAIGHGYKVAAFPILEYWRDIGQHHEMDEARREWNEKKKESNIEVPLCVH